MTSSLSQRRQSRTWLLALAGMLAGALLGLMAATPGSALEPTHLRISNASYGALNTITLGLNKSVIVDLPADVREVIVSQPLVAATIMRSKRRAIVQGAAVGTTNIFFLDSSGEAISVLDVTIVDSSSGASNAMELQQVLAKIIPGSRIQVESFGTRVVLSGTVQSGDDLQKAVTIATQFTGDATAIANVIQVGGTQQVMLKVTVAEVARETVKQLGINLSGSVTIGTTTLTLASQNALGGASGIATNNGVGLNIPGTVSIDAMLRALERRGSLRTLATPTLTAMSGQPAEFLAGGQFPVPSGVDNGVISFEFKQFGVGLKFTPTVKSNGIIGLIVDTSVSEPTTEGGFTLQGVTIPATRDRQAKTSVELPAGATLAIAGLFQDEVRQQINQMPGVGDIPILGALFRSRDFIRSQTELVILVTPYLAETGRPRLPSDDYVIATDAEAIFLGRMEQNYAVGSDGFRGGYDGSFGFVLD